MLILIEVFTLTDIDYQLFIIYIPAIYYISSTVLDAMGKD